MLHPRSSITKVSSLFCGSTQAGWRRSSNGLACGTIVLILLAALVLHRVSSSRSTSPATPLLSLVADIPMPGTAVRFDYQSLDPKSNRLYISHMNDGHVVVFDVKTRKVIANIDGVAGSTGVLAVPQLSRVFACASRVGQLVTIDQSRLQVLGRVPAGRFPDGLAYDPLTAKLFVSDESGGADIVIDAKTNRYLTTIALGGGVGNTQYDPVTHLIMTTIGDTNQLAVINPRTDQVLQRYSLPGSKHPHGLYIDAPNRLAFVACEGNQRLLLVDLRTMNVTAHYDVGEGPDVLAFDPALHRLYVACESGTISVFDERGKTLTKRGDVFVASAAHTIAVDPRTHLLYLPLENIKGHPLLRIMRPR